MNLESAQGPIKPLVAVPMALMAGLVLLLSTGCAGYRLGSMLPPDIRTVHVATLLNETDEPLLEIEATRALISAVQRDGSLRLVSEDRADATLTGRLTQFRLEPITFDRERRAAANEYRMYITAAVVLQRRETGEVVAQHPRVIGETTFVLTGDMTSSKQVALPAATEDLAQLIIGRLLESWQ